MTHVAGAFVQVVADVVVCNGWHQAAHAWGHWGHTACASNRGGWEVGHVVCLFKKTQQISHYH